MLRGVSLTESFVFTTAVVVGAAGRQRGEVGREETDQDKGDEQVVPMRRAVIVRNPGDDVIIGVEVTPSVGHPVDVPKHQVRPFLSICIQLLFFSASEWLTQSRKCTTGYPPREHIVRVSLRDADRDRTRCMPARSLAS